MATHFYNDCPVMNHGDEVLDKEGLDLEDWVYDCRTCQYVEHVEGDCLGRWFLQWVGSGAFPPGRTPNGH